MKIREVLEKTGLTDRAVRLYIEHELITPETKTNYSGRKNIEFSDEDVEKLRCISLLRKADFSLAQISRISHGGDDATAALHEFLTDKCERHAAFGEIIDSLKDFSGKVTLKGVADALENGGAEKLEIKDLYLTHKESIEKKIFFAWGIAFLILASLAIILPPIFYFSNIIFPKISISTFIAHIIFYIPVILVLIIGLTLIGRYRRGTINICNAKKRTISIISIIAAGILSFAGFFGVALTTMCPWIYTETKDIGDYLILNENTFIVNRDVISKLFPACSPDRPNNLTKYHYYELHDAFPSHIYFIYAEWVLSPKDYEMEKSRIDVMFPDAEKEVKEDFVCVYVKNFDPSDGVEAYFEYNDDTQIVRYVLNHYYLDSPDYLEQ